MVSLRYPSRRAFTLIELLVVIAIIAILAAILFPVFAQAREKARQATCVSNGKQIAVGMMMYVQDYDEIFPQSWTSGQPQRWMHKFQPYTKNRQINDCPSFEVKGYQNAAGDIGGGAYAYNRQVFETFPMAAIEEPAATIVFGDAATINAPAAADDLVPSKWTVRTHADHDMAFNTKNPHRNICWRWNASCDANSYRRPVARHAGGSVFAFADGHAKWYKLEQIIGTPTAPIVWGAANCLYDNPR